MMRSIMKEYTPGERLRMRSIPMWISLIFDTPNIFNVPILYSLFNFVRKLDNKISMQGTVTSRIDS